MSTYILDTNVILENDLEELVLSFPENSEIIIPICVLEELNRFKKGNRNINKNARKASRLLKQICLTQDYMFHNRKIMIYIDDQVCDLGITDNSIISLANDLSHSKDVTVVTNDVLESIVAMSYGLNVQESRSDNSSIPESYKQITLSDKQINNLYAHNRIKTQEPLLPNQIVELIDKTNTKHYGIYKEKDQTINLINLNLRAFGITPKANDNNHNIEQAIFMHMLLDPDIHFVSCLGSSGTGKTLLSLACGLEQVVGTGMYDKVTVLRPLVPVGEDIGYLPGTKEEKLKTWMASTFDNLEYIMTLQYQNQCRKKGIKKENKQAPKQKIKNLIDLNQLELEALTYIRGRSIPNQFIILDDAQNATVQEVTTLLTRMGEGSKLIFLGDVDSKQIDNPSVSSEDNGLMYAINKLNGCSDLVGHVKLTSIVRSELAELAVKLL